MTIHPLDNSTDQIEFIMNIKHSQQAIHSKASKYGKIVKQIIHYKEFSSSQPCIFYSTDDPYSINVSVQDKQVYYTEELKMKPTIFVREFMNIVKEKLEKDNLEFELKQIKDCLAYSYNVDHIDSELKGPMEQIIPTTNNKLEILKDTFQQLHTKYNQYIDTITYLQNLIDTKHESIILHRNKLYEYKFQYITQAKQLYSQMELQDDESILFQYYKTKLLLENYSEKKEDINIGSFVKLNDTDEYGIVVQIEASHYIIKLDIGNNTTVTHDKVTHKKSIETLLRELNTALENDFEIPLLDLYTFLNQKGYTTCMDNDITSDTLRELESRPYLVTSNTPVEIHLPAEGVPISKTGLIKYSNLPPVVVQNYKMAIVYIIV